MKWSLVLSLLFVSMSVAQPPALPAVEESTYPSFWVELDTSIKPSPIKTDISIAGDIELAVGESAMIHVPRSEMGSDYSILMRPTAKKWFVSEGRDSDGREVVTAVALDLPAGVYFLSFVSFEKRTHAVHRLVVGDGTPVDPDKPDDPVKPVVPVPNLTGLAKESFDNAMKVASSVRRAEAGKLASILEEIASPVVAGTPTSVFAMVQSLDQQIPPAIDEAAWKPWGVEFNRSRRAWQDTGITPKAFAEKLIESATGLKAAGGQP